MDAFSFGGGIQSVAVMVLMARGDVPRAPLLFANVGEDSEWPGTLTYYATEVQPYAERHGLDLQTVRRTKRDGSQPTLLEALSDDSANIPIPVRYAGGAPGKRNCTNHWKVQVVGQRLRAMGFTTKRPAVLGLGISTDEWQRAKDSRLTNVRHVFPLLDLRLSRDACIRLIETEGLPVPPKSACWFCPMKGLADWRAMQRDHPETFGRAVALERTFSARRRRRGKDAVYLSSRCQPLDVVVSPAQASMFENRSECESGYCMT
jgi:hypothetical protein